MALASTTETNQALATTGWAYLSLHTASPSTNGANEVSGGSYARVAVAWGSPSGGSVSNSGALTVNVPASTTVTHVGIWSASTAGTYYIGAALGSSITTTTAGTVTFAVGAVTFSAS